MPSTLLGSISDSWITQFGTFQANISSVYSLVELIKMKVTSRPQKCENHKKPAR